MLIISVILKLILTIVGIILMMVGYTGLKLYYNGDLERIKYSKNPLKTTYYTLVHKDYSND